jgi:hypothetical protein
VALACSCDCPRFSGPKGHILDDGGAEQLVVRILEQQADAAAHFVKILFRLTVPAEDVDAAGIRRQQSHDHVKESGLSAAVGGDDSDTVLLVKMKIQAVQRIDLAAGYRKVTPFQIDNDRRGGFFRDGDGGHA